MNVVDIVVLVPVLWGAFKGFKNGLISEGGTVLALILGVWASVSFSVRGGEMLQQYVGISDAYSQVAAFASIFILVVVLSFFVTKLLVKFFESIKLAWLDKLLGVLFGALKYIVVFAFLFFIIQTLVYRYSSNPVAVFEKSLFFKPLSSSAHALLQGSIEIPVSSFHVLPNDSEREDSLE